MLLIPMVRLMECPILGGVWTRIGTTSRQNQDPEASRDPPSDQDHLSDHLEVNGNNMTGPIIAMIAITQLVANEPLIYAMKQPPDHAALLVSSTDGMARGQLLSPTSV